MSDDRWYDAKTIIQFIGGMACAVWVNATWGSVLGATIFLLIASGLELLYLKFVKGRVSE